MKLTRVLSSIKHASRHVQTAVKKGHHHLSKSAIAKQLGKAAAEEAKKVGRHALEHGGKHLIGRIGDLARSQIDKRVARPDSAPNSFGSNQLEEAMQGEQPAGMAKPTASTTAGPLSSGATPVDPYRVPGTASGGAQLAIARTQAKAKASM